MTTDTFAKQTAVSLEVDGRRITVGGMAKGSGMIAPNMATMLAVITTDAPLTSRGVRRGASARPSTPRSTGSPSTRTRRPTTCAS